MNKAILINAEYVSSDRKPFQRNNSQLQRELKGWEIAGGSNGSYILAKPAQAIFVFKDTKWTHRYDMREDILEHAGKQKLTEKSFKTLKNMLKSQTLSVFIDEDGYYTLM